MSSLPGASRFDDVRMRGFRERATVTQVWKWLDDNVSLLEPEPVALAELSGRVLSGSVVAGIDVPLFDRSAMDGFAVRGSQTTGAGDYNPLSLRIIGQSLPGRPFADELQSGESVRIMTGAPIPAGADAVLPAEFAREIDGRVEFTAAIAPGRNIGRRGEDLLAGTIVLPVNRRLRPQDVGLLASIGMTSVPSQCLALSIT